MEKCVVIQQRDEFRWDALHLAPALAEQTVLAVRELLAESAAANTTRSYASALRYWAFWYTLRFGRALELPLEESDVVQFLVDHVGRRAAGDGDLRWELPPEIDQALVHAGAKSKPGPLKVSTVEHRLAVLSTAHKLRDLANPCENPAVKLLMRSARRAAHKRGDSPRKKTALGADDVRTVLDACDSSLAGIRDRALIALAFSSGGRRRSEVAQIQVEELRRTPAGDWVFRLERAKTLQDGPRAGRAAEKPVRGEAARALEAWLVASGVSTGPLFRRLRGDTVEGGLSGRAVAEIIKRRTAAAGLDGDFGGHSLRAGFSTEAGRQGVPLQEAMHLSDHTSVQTFLSYYQAGAVERNQAGGFLATQDD